MINKKLILGIFFIFGILILSSSVFAYTQSYYSSQNNNVLGLGIFSSGQSLKVDESMCQQGDDFLIQIGPLACTPTPVRSDLLEEENVNVFCQMTATQINPFVDVQRIDSISFTREYPKEVLGIGYQPAQSALGYTSDNLEGSLLLQNLGYVVITLRRQPNESALTNCKKDAFGTEICWVEGNLTANLRYDVQNVFGVGKAVFYLPVMDDTDWESNYVSYSFWEGRGYLRASSVGENDAVLSVYSDNTVTSSILSSGRKYTLARYSSNIPLNTGETSDKIFLPGLSPCLASLQLKLEGVVNPDTRAIVKVNEDYNEVIQGETFLEGKCKVSSMDKSGVTSKVKIICSGADLASERKPFELRISPQVNLSVGGVKKGYSVGDLLYKSSDGEKYVYLGYVGSMGESTDESKLYVTLVAIPVSSKDGDSSKLTESEIASVASWSETSTSSSDSGSGTVDFISNAFNKLASASMTVGKAVISGQNFVNIPYKKNAGDYGKRFGTDVSLEGFFNAGEDNTLISDNQNYTNAMSDFDTVITNYPNEVEKANSIQSLGEKAFYEKIYLANALGMKKTTQNLCKEFAQSYPDTYANLGLCTNSLELSSTDIAGKDITINGITKRISFGGVKEPSKSDYSAEVLVQGPNGNVAPYVLEKNKVVELVGFRTKEEQAKLTNSEYIKLEDLSTDSATVRITVAGKTVIQNILTSDNKLLKKGIPEPVEGYTFTLKDVNLNKVAKVSVISNQEFAKSNSTFNFKIGIEKRLIQLSPQKAQEKIIAQNKTIADLQKISDVLYTTVKTMKLACTVTGGYLTAKNLLANAGGKAIARQDVMGKTGDGGWNDKCAAEVRLKKYASLDACLLHFSDQIEKEVDNTYKIIQIQNSEIANFEKSNSGSSDNAGFINGYSKNVVSSLNSAGVTQALSTLTDEQKKNLDLTKVKGILNSDKSYTDYYEKNAYTLDQLKEIELYSSYIDKYGTDSNDQTVVNAKKNLISVLSDVYVNSNKYVQTATFASSLGIDSNKIPYIQTNVDTKKSIYYGFTNADTKIKGIPPETPVAVVQTETGNYIFILTKGSSEEKIYTISKVYDSAGKLITESDPNYKKLTNVVFEKFDATSYKNPFKSSYGSSEPLIRYYETAPYKGKPAIVPFDLKEGWYAGIQSPQTSYDSSGRVVSFWLCNVMENGIEQFQLDNFGGDACVLMNLNTGQSLSTFPGLDASKTKALVDKAKNAIEAAQHAYKEGVTKVGGIKVGEPPAQSSGTQCTDFMSPSDCNILFNVCDPVICPSSRCNLGGNYNVANVIQTGIIGSIALCYPNAKWNGGDVYVPVCISGVQAGLDNWISIQKSYRDCLQKSIDTGETVGVCDEINSIYTCEFFWKQSLPIIKYALPKIAGKITGQSNKGGGEYQGITSALDSAKKTVDYLKQYYAANSYNAFKVRSTEQVGTELCGSFISAIYPDSGSFLDNLITPDSPVQFTGKFDEIQLTTATNPPTSQYKVYYHIYAGKDTGVYYTVYLRGSGSSYYQDTVQNRNVKSGYIEKGGSADETIDFTSPSGYQQLCIVVNGQEECGFKEVSTSFAVNYLSDLYLAQQASDTNVTTEAECISGTTSIYNILNLNAEAATNNLINPQIYAQGIIRICSTGDPGVGTATGVSTESARWKKVGYCGQKGVGCWIDTDSVKNVIKTMNIENQALDKITNSSLQYLNGEYLTLDQFNAKLVEINAETSNFRKIELINDILEKIYYNNQKAQLFYGRGKAYSALAIAEYNALVQAKAEAAATTGPTGDCVGSCQDSCANGVIDGTSVSCGKQVCCITSNTLNSFNAKYLSPEFLLNDGNLLTFGDICYRYYNSVWQWAVGCDSTISQVTWNDVADFDKDTSARAKSVHDMFKEVIHSLQSQDGNYVGGLTVLVDKAVSNGKGSLSDSTGVTTMSKGGVFEVFEVKFTNTDYESMKVISFEYTDLGWFWEISDSYEGGGVWQKVSNLAPGFDEEQKAIVTALQDADLYRGAAILFDYSSDDIKEFFGMNPPLDELKCSMLELPKCIGLLYFTCENNIWVSKLVIGECGYGGTPTTLGNLQKRDLTKLESLMNSLSTSKTVVVDKTCICGNNCGNYAQAIGEASLPSNSNIPDELLLLAIMIQESSCKSVTSTDGGDIGLMQINTGNCGNYGLSSTKTACIYDLLNDAALNIDTGASILKDKYNSYKDGKTFGCAGSSKTYSEWEAALRGYNGWGCTGDNNYVEDVESKYLALVKLYNGDSGTTGTATCSNSLVGAKILSVADSKIGQDTTRVENGAIVYDEVCATFVSNVLIEAGTLPQFKTCTADTIPYRDAIVELTDLFSKDGYTEVAKSDWKSNLKSGDIIIWGGSGSYDPEYQHITIFSGYTSSGGITVVHDGGKNVNIMSKTYNDPFGTAWYVTHVWRATCPSP